MPYLFIEVSFNEGRYYGMNAEQRSEWPPSPLRLFQAFVAGSSRGSKLLQKDKVALEWLERLDPPLIAAPPCHLGMRYVNFVPYNALDAVNGHIGRTREIKTTKVFHPRLFDNKIPLIYLWAFHVGEENAQRILDVSSSVYQLGRGIDMAWAVGQIIDHEEVEQILHTYPGNVYRPEVRGYSLAFPCPVAGYLNGLLERYQKLRRQFESKEQDTKGKRPTVRQTLYVVPKPHFRMVPYNCPSTRLLYEMRQLTKTPGFSTFPLEQTARLVETVRNVAAAKLGEALPEKASLVNRVYGLWREAGEADKEVRIRITPLPSIGHTHADRSIRRVLVKIPPNCPLPKEDIAWSFASVGDLGSPSGGIPWTLVYAQDQRMLAHYGVEAERRDGHRIWRTVTPMVLSVARPSGRKNGLKRASVEEKAVKAVTQALGHAGVKGRPTSIRVQREPFDTKGIMAGAFASGTRFPSPRLWHVEIAFAEGHVGPLVAGDGRYLGLGLMRPVKQMEGIFAFHIIDGISNPANPGKLAHALRRAVMALVQTSLGPRMALPMFFTGHEPDGSPARRGGRTHLAFAFDATRQRLMVIAPHVMERREPAPSERKHLRLLSQALSSLNELRAGPIGLLRLEPAIVSQDTDPLFCPSRFWVALTPYKPTRYIKHTTQEEAIVLDLKTELLRRNLPIPSSIDGMKVIRGPKGGLAARMRLIFARGVRGPLLLGKDSNLGGGLFVSERSLVEMT